MGLQDARLRRAQAQAFENGLGLAIVRELAREKLERQRTVLDQLPDAEDAKAALKERVRALSADGTVIAESRVCEVRTSPSAQFGTTP